MLDFPIWNRITLWALTIALAALAVPSLMGAAGIGDPETLEEFPQVNLGLDLAGGSHLLLEGDRDFVAATRLENPKTLPTRWCQLALQPKADGARKTLIGAVPNPSGLA